MQCSLLKLYCMVFCPNGGKKLQGKQEPKWTIVHLVEQKSRLGFNSRGLENIVAEQQITIPVQKEQLRPGKQCLKIQL